MGSFNSKRCVPVSVFDARRHSNYYELGGAGSFSNPSLVTVTTEESNIIEASPSKQFSESYMESVYTQYKLENDLENNLTYNVVRIVSSIIETLSMDDHILFIANKFFERLYAEDPQYMNIFNNCLVNNEITQFDNKTYLLEHHMILHTMFYLRIHKFILTTLEDGKEDKAYEILNLIALSHLIMKVEADNFKKQSMKIIQVIIHFSLISEDQIPPFVYYLVTMVGYICTMMIKYSERNLKLYDTIKDHNSPARENYRELKKWKTIVMTLKKSLSKPMVLFEKQIEEEKKKVGAANAEDDEEQWKIIRLLKKGYKYRNKGKNNLKILHTNLQ